MNEEKSIVPNLFCIIVNGMENGEWQGEVQFADNAEAHFESLLGLLRLVRDKFESYTPAREQDETI